MPVLVVAESRLDAVLHKRSSNIYMVNKVFTISENLSCQGPVLKCRGSKKHRVSYLNEVVILEIWPKFSFHLL
jgi:hypothetical protein